MNKRFYITSIIIVAFLIAIIFLLVLKKKGKLSFSGRLGMSAFKRRLIDNANAEYAQWGYGKIKETDPDQLATLEKYWSDGAGVKYRGPAAVNNPWSAATISYLMRKSGAGPDFPYSASHSTYITQAIKNQKSNSSSRLKGYRIQEAIIQPGDLVCYSRNGSGATYDTVGSYESHCDLVILKNGISAESLGGNVSNSFSKTVVPLTAESKIDKTRTTKPYFAVLKLDK